MIPPRTSTPSSAPIAGRASSARAIRFRLRAIDQIQNGIANVATMSATHPITAAITNHDPPAPAAAVCMSTSVIGKL
jgi:hypothetical protein